MKLRIIIHHILISLIVLAFGVYDPVAVRAHQDPGACEGNRLAVALGRDKLVVQQGDTVTYSVFVSNLDGPVLAACGFTGVNVDLTLPAADGTATGTVVSMAAGVSYPAGMATTHVGDVPYVVNVNQGVTDIVAQVRAGGSLHDAPVDHAAEIVKTIGSDVVWPGDSSQVNEGEPTSDTAAEEVGVGGAAGAVPRRLPNTGISAR